VDWNPNLPIPKVWLAKIAHRVYYSRPQIGNPIALNNYPKQFPKILIL